MPDGSQRPLARGLAVGAIDATSLVFLNLGVYKLGGKNLSSRGESSNFGGKLTFKHKITTKTSDYQINFGTNYFPRKTYKGVIYEAGNYESLVITLGKGLGENWWCILYPPLCLIDENTTTSDVEYRLIIQDILNN